MAINDQNTTSLQVSFEAFLCIASLNMNMNTKEIKIKPLLMDRGDYGYGR